MLDDILAHSKNPRQPATFADTYLPISLMVIYIQNISYFRWNLQSLAFSITGVVSVPLAPRLVVTSQSLITPNHI